MADFYFYTDLDKIANQESTNSVDPGAKAGMSFGPFGHSYQLSNLHYPNDTTVETDPQDNSPENPGAYAICNGILFCVAVPGSNTLASSDPNKNSDDTAELVNIILKPSFNPENSPKVKYYIYRSVLKKSLIEGVGTNTNVIADTNKLSNDLIKRANSQLQDNSIPRRGDVFGLPFSPDDAITENTLIDDIFSQPPTSTNFLKINAGDCIGYFPQKSSSNDDHNYLIYFGMEIMLDTMGFNPKIKDVKQSFSPANLGNSNIIEFSPVQNDTDSPLEKYKKEYVLNYMDAAAFYGNFYEILIKKETADKLWIKGDAQSLNADELYNRILIGTDNISKNTQHERENNRLFKNSNRIYIDIRNEFNFSLNYFGEFSNSNKGDIKIKWEHETDVKDYKNIHSTTKGRNDYPILIFEKDSNELLLPEIYKVKGTRDKVVLTTDPKGLRHKELKLKLKFYKNSPTTGFYTSYINSGNVISKNNEEHQKVKFKDINTLIKNLEDDKDESDFDNYTNSIDINVYHYENDLGAGNIDDQKVNHCIAKHMKMTIIKHESDIQKAFMPSPLSLKSFEYLDNIFLPIDQIINFRDSNKNFTVKVDYEAAYVNNIQVDGTDFMADIGIAKNVNGDITLFANAHEFRGENTSQITKITSQILQDALQPSTGNTFLRGLVDSINIINQGKGRRLGVDDKNIIDGSNNITLQNIVDEEGADIKASDNLLSPPKGFIAITISSNDFATIQSVFTTNQASFLAESKVFLAFKYDSFNSEFTKYEILIRCIGTDGQIKEFQTGVFHYICYPSVDLYLKETEIKEPHGYKIINFDPSGFQIPVQQIHSDVFFMRGLNTSINEFNNYIEFFLTDIKKVWNSTTNKGLKDDPEGVNINADYVIPFIITPFQLKKLRNKEIVVLVQRGGSRSFATSRTMMMYFAGSLNSNDHTPSHEFGHIMGLSDRYCYMGIYYEGNERDGTDEHKEILPSSVKKRVLEKAGLGVTLYLPPDEDPEYSTNYRWNYNLFSTCREVPAMVENEPLFSPEDKFKEFHGIYKPTTDTITLFITSRQWGYVKNYGSEPSYVGDKVAFFKKANLPSGAIFNASIVGFKGTFLGKDSENGVIKTDDTFVIITNASAPNMDDRLNPNLDSLYKGQFTENPGFFIEYANDKEKLKDLKTGGFPTSRKKKILGFNTDLDLTGTNDKYLMPNKAIGTADEAGTKLWNAEEVEVVEGTEKVVVETSEEGIKFNNHFNRIAIAITIGTAKGPR